MDYKGFSVEDFVLDPFFRSWVMNKTPAAIGFWEKWLAGNPGKAAIIEEARELVLCLDFRIEEPTAIEIREVKDAILAKLKLVEKKQRKPAYFYPLAASIAFLLLASTAVFFFIYSPKLNISTTFSETRNIILPDGSEVVLNANSRISYARDWKKAGPREVWLDGEAFFEITKMPQRENPEFYVHVGELTIEVLGTAFNVYNRGGKTSVVLQEGSVELSSRNKIAVPDKLLMKPGDKVNIQDNSYEIERVSTEPYISWKDRRMIFEDMELSEIARMLEDNYGYRTVFKDPELKTLRFTGSYSTEKIDIFLKAIEEAFDIQVIKYQQTITFQ